MKRHRRRQPPKPRVSPSVLERINPHAAGIDCGSAEHFVAVPPDRDPTPVRSFATFTGDLQRLADWLTACRVTSVAMEATERLLDPRVRDPGSAWLYGRTRERTSREERAGSEK